MRIVMMGTGSFAVPTLRLLYESDHEIVGLFTSPCCERRSRSKRATPMRDLAVEHKTPVFDPCDINAGEATDQLLDLNADVFVVCDCRHILSAETLCAAKYGGVNLHCSLLPKYRGAAPINWAIYNGDTETGVSVIHMTPKIDAGPLVMQSPPIPIDPDENAEQLKCRLADIGAPYVLKALDAIASETVDPLPQDPSKKSPARKIRKSDGLIHWERSASQIRNQWRAMQPWPKTYTFWRRQGEDAPPQRLILASLHVASEDAAITEPGTVVRAEGDRLIIATAEGFLQVGEVQPAGKKLMPVEAFLRGYPIQAGDKFGPENEEE
jgi:methionyl-tRNA formyltransferase